MSREDRKKASEVFRDTTFVFAKKVPFDEAFPQIKDVRVEVQETSRGSERLNPPGKMVYTRDNFPGEYIDCRTTSATMAVSLLETSSGRWFERNRPTLKTVSSVRDTKAPRRESESTAHV